jgi:hypothetical protein
MIDARQGSRVEPGGMGRSGQDKSGEKGEGPQAHPAILAVASGIGYGL